MLSRNENDVKLFFAICYNLFLSLVINFIFRGGNMAIYLETNALRKLTDYSCNQSVVTSIFSIFELLSGVKDQNDYHIRRQCLQRIKKQNVIIRFSMIDELFGVPDYN